jgi:transcriptional regulator GlxA family with amidase domain
MPKYPRSSPNPIRAIEVLTFPAVQLLDVTGPVQVFASTNDLVANAGDAPPYRFKLVTQGGQGVVSSAGVTLAAGPLSQRSEALDTLLVAGGQGVEAAAANPALINWLQ